MFVLKKIKKIILLTGAGILLAGPSSVLGAIPMHDNEVFYSQASQDRFVQLLLYQVLGKQDAGYYLEIGAGTPVFINNTYFFEKNLGWKGVSIEIDNTHGWYPRQNPLRIENALYADYCSILSSFPYVIDYLTLDIDGQYDTVLKRIPFDAHIFKIITIEHDFYQYGDRFRSAERKILNEHGYYLLCADVSNTTGYSFEDWWIHPSAFPADVLDKIKSLDLNNKHNEQIIKTLQSVIQ